MIDISTLIIAQNEAQNIEKVINSVKGLGEIIVLDSGSNDGTGKIAEQLGANVYYTDWAGYPEQRRRALKKASNQWCLFIDADEELDEKLYRAIQDIKPETGVSGYYLKRSNRFLGKELKQRRWANDWQLRLFLKKDAYIADNDVHEGVIVNGRTVRLEPGRLIHNTTPSLKKHLEKINRYTTLEARQRLKRGEKYSLVKLLLSPVVEFWKMYLFQGGFRDGLEGIAVASLSALYKVIVIAKMYETVKVRRREVS